MEFTEQEKQTALEQMLLLKERMMPLFHDKDVEKMHILLKNAFDNHFIQRDVFGLNPLLFGLQTAEIAMEEIGLKRDGLISIILYSCQISEHLSNEDISNLFGSGVAQILHGLERVKTFFPVLFVGINLILAGGVFVKFL